jgi:hypothetical protein
VLLGVELALATVARDGSGHEARGEILRRWGRGHGQVCRRVRVGGETVAMQRPQVA